MALTMHLKQITTCLFFGYLVLLLNLGSSLHHAHFFGLHHHQGPDSVVSDDSATGHQCCGCHRHCHSPTEASNPSGSIHSDHDCAFCNFFDQYHVTLDVIEYQSRVCAIEFQRPRRPVLVDAALLIANARGPPSKA